MRSFITVFGRTHKNEYDGVFRNFRHSRILSYLRLSTTVLKYDKYAQVKYDISENTRMFL